MSRTTAAAPPLVVLARRASVIASAGRWWGGSLVAQLFFYIVGIVVAIVIAWLSYHLFEKHFLRIKEVLVPGDTLRLITANQGKILNLPPKPKSCPGSAEWTLNLESVYEHIDTGRFAVKAGTSQINGHAFNRSLFTPKGIEWLAGLWAVHCLDSEVAA